MLASGYSFEETKAVNDLFFELINEEQLKLLFELKELLVLLYILSIYSIEVSFGLNNLCEHSISNIRHMSF